MKCEICRKIGLKKIVDFKITSLFHCGRCGVVFAEPNYQNRKGDFFDAYQVDQWLEYYRSFRTRTHRRFLEHHGDLLASAGSVLDIGCAAGWFLDVVRERRQNVKTIGVEPSPAMRGKINRIHRIYRLPAEDLDAVNEEFDLVTLWNVFEHFHDPRMILGLVSKKLKNSGRLILSVPNHSGLISRISYLLAKVSAGRLIMPLEELFQTDNAFGHLFHYNRKSLDILLRSCGFEPIWWEGEDIVDVSNVRQRLKVTTNRGDEIKQQVLAAVVAQLTRIAGTIGLQDEMVVMARRI